jgi:hypothetical protein
MFMGGSVYRRRDCAYAPSVRTKRTAWIVVVGGVALVAAACSGGGGSHVAVGGSATTVAGGSSNVTDGDTSAKTPADGTKVKAKAKPSATKPGAPVTTRTTIVNGVVVTVPVTAAPGGGGPPGVTPSPPTTIEQPVPYDPSKPINLCCVPGVTPQEQARAEQLVRSSLSALPKWSTPGAAYADGYRSIQDGFTGDEHYVKWSVVDHHILDPSQPESLVYENGKLVAAMFMMWEGSTFADTPDIGGALTQWHVHNDLCLEQNPHDALQWYLRGVVNGNGQCTATGAVKKGNVPMIHVWIVKNKCGPFAPLEGEGGGQTPPGQAPLCDRAHGS